MTKSEKPKSVGRRPSVVYSAMVVVGLLLLLVGAGAALLGVGRTDAIDFTAWKVHLKTSSTGLMIMAVGLVVSVGGATLKPKDVLLFGDPTEELAVSRWARVETTLRRPAPMAACLGAVITLLAIALVAGR